MFSKKIKFKSKAELWFPTVIWETELDEDSKKEINSDNRYHLAYIS